MKELLKSYIKKSIALNSAARITHRILHNLRILSGNIYTISGTTHINLSVDKSIDYIEQVYEDYKRVSKRQQFNGRLAELGPGDNIGVVLMFLANGISEADAPDRFYSYRDNISQNKIYDALANKHPNIKQILLKTNASEYEKIPRIKRYYGPTASGEKFFNKNFGYDVIISRSVLEHLDDPLNVLQNMYKSLNMGGILIHKIDLRDHGMFTPYQHATKFLEVPKLLYTSMTHGTGYPNRILFHQYKKTLESLNGKHKYWFYISGLHGTAPLEKEYSLEELPIESKKESLSYIKQHKHKYSKEFKCVADEELMVSSFFLVCEKTQ